MRSGVKVLYKFVMVLGKPLWQRGFCRRFVPRLWGSRSCESLADRDVVLRRTVPPVPRTRTRARPCLRPGNRVAGSHGRLVERDDRR